MYYILHGSISKEVVVEISRRSVGEYVLLNLIPLHISLTNSNSEKAIPHSEYGSTLVYHL